MLAPPGLSPCLRVSVVNRPRSPDREPSRISSRDPDPELSAALRDLRDLQLRTRSSALHEAPHAHQSGEEPHHPGAIWNPKCPPLSGRWKGYA